MKFNIKPSFFYTFFFSIFFMVSCTKFNEKTYANYITKEEILNKMKKKLDTVCKELPSQSYLKVLDFLDISLKSPLFTSTVSIPKQPYDKSENEKKEVVSDLEETIRLPFVRFQQLLEETIYDLLNENALSSVSIVFHTGKPPTPFRQLVEDKICPESLNCETAQTVATSVHGRIRSMHRLASLKDKIKIFNVYPQSSLYSFKNTNDTENKHAIPQISDTEEKQYKENLRKYTSLVDCPILCGDDLDKKLLDQINELSTTMCGATYILKSCDPNKTTFLFSIQAQQAHTKTNHPWQIWFDILEKESDGKLNKIKKRYNAMKEAFTDFPFDQETKKSDLLKTWEL